MPKPDRNELRNRVDQVLLKTWDPLRVGDTPEANDEYRTYSKRIVEMLVNGRDTYAVAVYLRQAESGWLGSANELRLKKVVSLLFKQLNEID